MDHPNWLLARSELETILGEPCEFEIDQLPGIDHTHWSPCLLDGDTEEERWRQLCATVGFTPESGLLILVPITSYGPLGPFFTQPDKLTGFFEQHIASAADCVLSSGDLFVLAPQEGRAIIYHHSELALLLPLEQ